MAVDVALSESTSTSFLPGQVNQTSSHNHQHYFLVEMRVRTKMVAMSKFTVVAPERIVGESIPPPCFLLKGHSGRGRVINFTGLEIYGLMQQGASRAAVRSKVPVPLPLF